MATITEDEDALKKIEKKERRITREEAAEKKRREKVQRAHERVQSFKSTDAGAQEILTMLPYLDKQEKKHLYNALKPEQEEEEMKHFHHDYDREMVKRSGDRRGGYTAKAAPRPSTAASSARGTNDPPPAKSENQMPEPVRKKKLKEFRWHLYDGSLDRKGRCKPSEASDLSTKEQEL